MKPGPSLIALSALAALAVSGSPARAGLEPTGFEAPAPVTVAALMPASSAGVLDVAAWKRRRQQARRPEAPGGSSFVEIHGGFYDPDGIADNGFIGGFRFGGGEGAQIGVGADWAYRTSRTAIELDGQPLPGGGTSRRLLELSEASSHIVPVTGFIQLTPRRARGMVPYFGIAGGYEWFVVSGNDFQNGIEFDATYGGWGWQTWGGFAVPLTAENNLTIEYFRNTSEVGRDVYDPSQGVVYREVVDLDGGGMRVGLNWKF